LAQKGPGNKDQWGPNPERPKGVTRKKARAWQPYVDRQIRNLITRGRPQEAAVERALDLRDAHILAGDKPPK
jgi:hypothetical protein